MKQKDFIARKNAEPEGNEGVLCVELVYMVGGWGLHHLTEMNP